MSLLSTSFPSGMTAETEGATMLAGVAFAYGQIGMVDQATLQATTLKRYKMIASTAAGLLGTTAGEFGVCIEPNGIASGSYGRFVFVSDDIEISFQANENISIGDQIRPDHANGTAALKLNAINDAASAVGERFVGRAIVAATAAAVFLTRCRFNGLNPVAWRTV